MQVETIKRHSAPVPRYTSYPTAPHFSTTVGAAQYADWLRALPTDARLSIYVHIPFCQEICWYCGCTTKAARRYEPVTAYLASLEKEIAMVATLAPKGHTVTHMHWGGGSPNALTASDIASLAGTLKEAFHLALGAEFAVEIDPRGLSPDQVQAFGAAGVNRVSVGVQDFDPEVQRAINRLQSFDDTKRAIDLFRAEGIRSLNVDLVYGLPRQTQESAERTIEQVVTLKPDRIALFGYAHLPQRIKHQRLIDERTLPGTIERYQQFEGLSRRLEAAGYVQIGLDHFALKTDPLAQHGVHRNFQGYTTDNADALIGLGASSIGQLPQGYVQNAPTAGEYQARIRANGLATVRGVALETDDRVRAFVIERLMCDFELSESALRGRFGGDATARVIAEAREIVASDRDGLVRKTGDGFSVTSEGRPFVRTICAKFDAYLGRGQATHAPAV